MKPFKLVGFEDLFKFRLPPRVAWSRDKPLFFPLSGFLMICMICFSLFNNQLEAQEPPGGANGQLIISGIVRSSQTNSPLAGATLKIDEVTTRSNRLGEFSLHGPFNSNELSISHLGYKDTVITLSNIKTNLDILLTLVDHQIEEVEVVSTGYQSIPKERTTGSFAHVDAETLQRNPGTDLLSRLNGVTNGLLIDRGTGNPDGISVRGRSTIFSSTRPLIVVDNFPYEGDLDNINPNDIESVTVLKDATAASIWGVRSGNGVIVITTKKAKEKFSIDFSSNLTASKKPDLGYLPQMSSSEFIDVEKFLFEQGYYDSDIATGYTDVSPVIEILEKVRSGKLSYNESRGTFDSFSDRDVREHLEKYFYRNKIAHQQHLKVSSASTFVRSSVGVGYDRSLNDRVSDNQERFSLRTVNQLVGMGNRFNAEINGWYTVNNTGSGNASGYRPKYPYDQLVDDIGRPREASSSSTLRKSYTDTVGDGLLLDWKFRPVEEIQNNWNRYENTDQQLRFDLGFTGKIYRSFTAKASFLLSEDWIETSTHYDKEAFYVRDLVNQFSSISKDGMVTRPVPAGDILNRSTTRLSSRYGRIQLDWDETIGEELQLSGLLGAEWRRDRSLFDAPGYLYGYDPDLETHTEVDIFSFFPIYHNADYKRLLRYGGRRRRIDNNRSWYGLFAYSFRKNLTLTGSMRKDASNIFGVAANQKGVPLWSVGSSYSFQDILKLKNFRQLKFRLTYGYNGNIDKNTTAYLTSRLYQDRNLWDSPADIIVNPPNSTLRWERVSNINFGLDIETIRGKFGATIDYFIKTGKDLMGHSPIAPQTGISEFYGNVAKTSAKGLDLQLWFNWFRNTDMRFRTDLIFNTVKDRVTDYYVSPNTNTDIVTSGGIVPLIGSPINSLVLYKSLGLNDEGDPTGYLNGETSTDYSEIFNGSDRRSIIIKGSRVPTHFGSIRNTFGYKGVEVSFQILYKFGNFLRNPNSLSSSRLLAGNYRFSDYQERWIKKGDEMNTQVPRFVYPADINREEFYQYSTELAVSGSLIRLQDIRISYSFSPLIGFDEANLQMFLYGSNLGLIWKNSKLKLDPDFMTNYPNPLELTLGVKFNY